MSVQLTLVTRDDCCLCDDMKTVVTAVAAECGAVVEICDVDADPTLHARFSDEVPVLLINGRKAFKYRLSAAALRQRIGRVGGMPRWRGILARLR